MLVQSVRDTCLSVRFKRKTERKKKKYFHPLCALKHLKLHEVWKEHISEMQSRIFFEPFDAHSIHCIIEVIDRFATVSSFFTMASTLRILQFRYVDLTSGHLLTFNGIPCNKLHLLDINRFCDLPATSWLQQHGPINSKIVYVKGSPTFTKSAFHFRPTTMTGHLLSKREITLMAGVTINDILNIFFTGTVGETNTRTSSLLASIPLLILPWPLRMTFCRSKPHLPSLSPKCGPSK